MTWLLDRSESILARIPPLLIIAIALLPVGLIRHNPNVNHLIKSNIRNFVIYAIVLVAEVLTLLQNGNLSDSIFLFGRAGFMVIFVTIILNFRHINQVRSALYAFTIGTAILGLLTVLHAFNIFSLPIAMEPLAARTYFGFTFPVARSLGIGMSYGKFGIMCSLALAVLIFSSFSSYKIVPQRLMRWVSALLIFAGVLISQGRGVYITVAAVVVLSLILVKLLERESSDVSNTSQDRRQWILLAVFAGLMLAAAFLFMPSTADTDVLDVSTSKSRDNIVGRIDANQLGLRLFVLNPFLGIGHNSAGIVEEVGNGIHNHLLEQLVATGLLGGLPYITFHILILFQAWKIYYLSSGKEGRVLGGILFVGSVATLLEYQVFPGFIVEVFAFICGLIMALHATNIDMTLTTKSRIKTSTHKFTNNNFSESFR